MTDEQMKKIGAALVAAGQALLGETISAKEATKGLSNALQTAEETAAQIVEEAEAQAETEAKPKRTRKTKAAKEETKVEAAPETKEETKVEEKPNGATKYSHDDLRKALVEFAKKHGKAKAYELLGEFGAKKAIEVPEDKLGSVFTRLEGHA